MPCGDPPARGEVSFMRRRTAYLTALLAVVTIWVIGLGCWPLFMWSPLNRSCEDIDINSGRIRYRQFLLGLCVYTSVEETSMSRLVSDDAQAIAPHWRLANMFSSPFGHYSPQYLYGGAISHVRQIEQAWNVFAFTLEAKRQMARDVLSLWQSGEGSSPVGEYLNELDSMFSKRSHATIDIGDLPKVEAILARRRLKRSTTEGP